MRAFPHRHPLGLLFWRCGQKILSVPNDHSVYRAHESYTGTAESAQVLTRENRKSIHYSVGSSRSGPCIAMDLQSSALSIHGNTDTALVQRSHACRKVLCLQRGTAAHNQPNNQTRHSLAPSRRKPLQQQQNRCPSTNQKTKTIKRNS